MGRGLVFVSFFVGEVTCWSCLMAWAGRVRVFIDSNESPCWSFWGGADVS